MGRTQAGVPALLVGDYGLVFVAWLEEDWWFSAHAYAWGCAGGDDVAGVQAHEAAQVANDVGDREDHGFGVATLILVVVYFQPHIQVLWVGDFVSGDQPRADGAEGVGTFAFGPLAGAFGLEGALRDVVDDAVAGYVGEGVGLGDV